MDILASLSNIWVLSSVAAQLFDMCSFSVEQFAQRRKVLNSVAILEYEICYEDTQAQQDKDQAAFHWSESVAEHTLPYLTFLFQDHRSVTITSPLLILTFLPLNIWVWKDTLEVICLHNNAQNSQLPMDNEVVWEYAKLLFSHCCSWHFETQRGQNQISYQFKYLQQSSRQRDVFCLKWGALLTQDWISSQLKILNQVFFSSCWQNLTNNYI